MRKTNRYRAFDRAMPTTAFQPKFENMNPRLQPQGSATMSTGGAAKFVSVPPTETLRKSRASVAYLSRLLGPRE